MVSFIFICFMYICFMPTGHVSLSALYASWPEINPCILYILLLDLCLRRACCQLLAKEWALNIGKVK